MMQLNNDYQRDDFIKFLEEDFLTDFKRDIRPVNTGSSSSIQKASYLGESKGLDLQVFEFSFKGSPNKRVALTKDAFSVMRSSAIYNALAVFHSPDKKDWRFSLMTATPEPTEKGKVSFSYSNPKRLSFFLGPNAKINTPTKFLINKGKIVDLEDLKSRFSIEVVNKEFYKEISQAFTKLVNGLLKLPSTQDKSQTNLEFAVRLIGRVIFCWFLREKKSEAGFALMPKDLLSLEAVIKNKNYYHKILEPIFFEVLNKSVRSRREDFAKEPFSSVPYLNGGLFSPQDDDYYKRTNGDLQSQFHNTLVISDNWFREFFEILETYNFTIDENTSYDEELSIDPEMLGRIFENLLAEINPETGESARKSTGSYYTPRIIVNYMVDESILLYLKEQTRIDEEKLRAIISYDLSDDAENPVTANNKEKITDALEKVKILDPACGSGAFPIGALQKIVFILQQTDPDGQLWFKKQIKNTSPEIRRVVEREFSHKNFDYIRKLGIIRENIYGVDIQPIATEISRLRCFLTLIVDERVQDESENRGIEPLPNLDFKFVTANSLIGLPKIDLNQKSMFDDYQKIDELKNIRDQYFNASGIEREQLKTEFVMQQKRLVDQLIKEHGFMGVVRAELTQKLTDWEPFTHKSTSWFDPEWMFGIKNGFDVVIANPPWGSDLSKEEKQKLKSLYTEIDSSTPNSFAYFIGLAIKSGNIISYVLPDSILIKDFAKTRELLAPYLTEISWYQNTGLPENLRPFVYVEHDVCVIFASKSSEEYINTIVNKYDNQIGIIKSYVRNLDKKQVIFKEFDFSYNLSIDDKDIKILEKFQRLEPLSKYLQCHEGIHSGNIREKLFLRNSSNDRSKPLFYGAGTGGDKINNYYSQRNGWYADYRKEIVNKNNGEYASLRDERIFNRPKIYITRTGNPFKAFLDDNNYASNNFFSLQIKDYEKNNTENLKEILPLITSKLTQYFIRKFAAPRLGNTFVETKIIHLLKMRIPLITSNDKARLIYFSDSAIQLVKDDKLDDLKILQDEIDQFVYKLYGITSEEIVIVEGSKK